MGREYPATPLVGVGAVILDGDRVAMIRRANEPMKGHWALPGGIVELGESLREAVVREVREETGLEVEALALLENVDRIDRDGERIRFHYVIADYLCRVTGGQLRAGSDADEACWVERHHWQAQGRFAFDAVTLRVLEIGWQAARRLEENFDRQA